MANPKKRSEKTILLMINVYLHQLQHKLHRTKINQPLLTSQARTSLTSTHSTTTHELATVVPQRLVYEIW